MAVVNTTYNFNQPNMNFGQALLYGAFGSLTGGMGMYGGYGMGMGGSLFSMIGMGMGGYGCGFGGYGIGGYSDGFASMQLGNAFAGIALNCLTQAIGGGRGGNSSEEVKTKTLEDYKKDAEEQIGAVEDKKIEKAKENAATASEQYKILSSAQKRISEIPEEISKLEKQKITKGSGENGAFTEKETQQNTKIDKEIARLNDEKKAKEKELNAALNAIKNLDIKGLENITEYTSETVITAAANQAIKDAEKAKTEAINKLAKELKEADEAEAKKQADRAKLEDDINKVDGNSASRTRASKVKEKFESTSKDYDENDLQGALAGYRKNPNDSKTWAKILKDIITSGNVNIKSGYKNVLKTIPEIKSDPECMKYLNE